MKLLEQSLNEIKNKGFTHMKFELEANFNIEYGQCEECEGRGSYVDDYDNSVECSYCDATGRTDNNYLTELEGYIVNAIPSKATEKIVFARAYNDGSVDTEYTFTVSLEGVKYVPDIMKAFQDYCDKNGGDFNIDNAGFHISVLTDSKYPCDKPLNNICVDNFSKQVTRLLPALYHEATASNKTRGLEYRPPRVTTSKYSSITIHHGAIEYRLFDPCFNKPKQVFEYVKVIANTLRYYSKLKLKKNLYEKFEIKNNLRQENNLGILYSTSQNIKALQSTLKYVNPDAKLKIRLPKDNKLKFAEQIKFAKEYHNWVAETKNSYKSNLKRDWVDLKKWQAQTKMLSDLDKLTAREYVDIQNNKMYAPDAVVREIGQDGAQHLNAEKFLKVYNSFINSHIPSFDEYINRERNNRSQPEYLITG